MSRMRRVQLVGPLLLGGVLGILADRAEAQSGLSGSNASVDAFQPGGWFQRPRGIRNLFAKRPSGNTVIDNAPRRGLFRLRRTSSAPGNTKSLNTLNTPPRQSWFR
jgi:hypothetical protein